MNARLTFNIHEEDDHLWAEAVELPGCFASGKDLDELVQAISEAVMLYLDDNPEGQEIISGLLGSDPNAAVVDFTAHKKRKHAEPRLKISDIHANVEFDELIEA